MVSEDEPLAAIEPGTYVVGRDIAPGTYHGKAETGLDGLLLLGTPQRTVGRLG